MDEEPSAEVRLRQSDMDADVLAAAVGRANRWLARFAPLVRNVNASSAAECRKRLTLVADLRASGPTALRALDEVAGTGEAELAATLRAALGQMDGLEADYRRQLGALAPGDPQGSVDLAALQQDLAAVAARHEVELVVGAPVVPAELEMTTSPANMGAAAGMGLFSFGWLSFTAFHATLMIGGMYRTFGLFALVLLGFYAIFFGVGFAMAWSAWQMAVRESITLTGRRLVVHRSLFGLKWETRHDLAPDSRARLEQSSLGAGKGRQPARQIALTAADGREVRLGRGASRETQRQCVTRLNEYLEAVRQA